MAKHPVIILGVKYQSKALAAEQLGVSKYPLYALLKSGERVTKTKLNQLKLSKGKKKFIIPIKIGDQSFPSINAAADEFELDHNALWKALDGETEVSLSFIEKLQSRKRGYHKKSVIINGTAYPSRSAAARALNRSRQFIDLCVNKASSENKEIYLSAQSKHEDIEKSSVQYMRLKAEACGLFSLEDWYNKKRDQLDGYQVVGRLLKKYWKSDILFMLSKLFPDQKVRWWFFHKTPDGVYDKIHLRREYMDWLELKLGYKCETDWYQVTHDDFNNNYGRSLVTRLGGVLNALQDYYFNFEWQPWKFAVSPNGSWQNKDVRLKFLNYLEAELNISSNEHWYDINVPSQIRKFGGRSLLKQYDNYLKLLEDLRSEYYWEFWKFKRSPVNYWREKEYQLEYLSWLGTRLGIAKWTDWYEIVSQDFEDNYGITLLTLYDSSVSTCIMSLYKNEFKWEKIFFYKNEFKRERRLFGIISCGLPHYTVYFRYRHPDLKHQISDKKMEFDIFIEELNSGIEYHGKQHYEIVERFHGKDPVIATEKLKHSKMLDAEKREKVSEAKLNLWEIKYSEWDGSLNYIIKYFNDHFGILLSSTTIFENASKRGFVDNEIIYLDEHL